MMNINLYIDRLILDGLPIERNQAPQIQAAVETELTRLFTKSDFTAGLQSSIALPSLHASAIQFSAGNTPTQLGNQIAQSVSSGIGAKR